MTMHQAVFED